MLAQIIAVVIFVAMFAMIIMDVTENYKITLTCALATIVILFGIVMHSPKAIINTLALKQMVSLPFWYESGHATSDSSGINWATIIFILGMMIMVEGMAKSGFFRWLCMTLAKAVGYRVIPLFITFMLISAVLSMFIASITVILFLASITLEIADLLEVDPVPMIIAEIFCSNLGGAATMSGDPPNIILGTSLGYTFGDFMSNTGLMSGICLIFVLIYFYLVYRKTYAKGGKNIDPDSFPAPATAIKSKSGFAESTIIFALTVVLLITHAQTGLTVASIGAIAAILTLICAGRSIPSVLKGVDYKTLLFFIGLFVVVCGVEETGILGLIATFIKNVSGGNAMIMVAIIIWVSACASAIIDNIPFVATMIPVIKSLSAATGVSLPMLAWALSMGTDIGGSATPIGASANVIGTSVSAKDGHPISWGRYCKVAIPITAIVILISMLIIFARYL